MAGDYVIHLASYSDTFVCVYSNLRCLGRELALHGLVLDRPTWTCTRIPGSAFLLNPEFAAEAKELTLSDSRLIPALEVIATRVLSDLPAASCSRP